MSDTDTTETESAPMTKAEKKALFDARLDAVVAVDEAKAALAAAEAAVSDACGAIHANVGSGPFLYKGEKFRIVNKKGTCFSRSLGEPEVEKIG